MRILLAHNFYQSSAPSGEDVVYRNERSLLEKSGHEVIPFEKHNDEISASILKRAETAVESVWSRRTYRELSSVLTRTRPHVAHFHNTFPLITPSAYQACRDQGVPVVQTLHNYRLLCPGGLFMRNGKPCEKCLHSTLAHSIRHACYRQSRIGTSIVATGLTANRARGVYRNLVDRYIALTSFAKERFTRGGLPSERIVVRPNGLAEAPDPGAGAGDYVLYVGRLTQEKGVETLLRAWSGIENIELLVVGEGALRSSLEARYGKPSVRFLGLRPRAEVWRLMQNAAIVVTPSECYEGFPMTIVEAYAAGAPVIASAIGALGEIVLEDQNGLRFPPGDSQSLALTVQRLMSDPALRTRMGQHNRREFERLYSRGPLLSSLLGIYEDAVKTRASSE